MPLELILTEKIKLDEIEYPVERFKGHSRYQVIKDERKRGKIPPIPTGSLSSIFTIADIQTKAWEFVRDREWEHFYSPTSLALAIAVKSGEVATSYPRRPKPIKLPYERMVWALADILLNAMRLCELLGIHNSYDIVQMKLDKDEERFIGGVAA